VKFLFICLANVQTPLNRKIGLRRGAVFILHPTWVWLMARCWEWAAKSFGVSPMAGCLFFVWVWFLRWVNGCGSLGKALNAFRWCLLPRPSLWGFSVSVLFSAFVSFILFVGQCGSLLGQLYVKRFP